MFVKHLGVIFVIASVTASDVYEKCVHFEGESGFIQLPPEVLRKNPTIGLEVKAYNCDDISFSFYNQKENFKLTLPVEGNFFRGDGDIRNFRINGPCNGLWHKATFVLHDSSAYFKWDDETIYPSLKEIKGFVESFDGESIFVGIHFHNSSSNIDEDDYRTYEKPFEGFVRNVTLDDRYQSIQTTQLNGTLVTKTCPKDLVFSNDEGYAKVTENVTFGQKNRIYFETRIPNCRDTSVVLVSAFGEDSFLILQIIDNTFHVKTKAGDRTYSDYLQRFTELDYCDGKWHKFALLIDGKDIRIVGDNTASSTNFGFTLDFTASLYIGQNPKYKNVDDLAKATRGFEDAATATKGFKGCLRSLQVNGVVPEILEDHIESGTLLFCDDLF